MNETLHIGYYSAKAAEECGSSTWVDDLGMKYEVTAVYTKENAADYKWPDRVVVSTRLVECVGNGRKGTSNTNRIPKELPDLEDLEDHRKPYRNLF